MLDSALIAGVRRDRLDAMKTREAKRFAQGRPRTQTALAAGSDRFLGGVPMHWMKDWPMPFPLLVAKARGARLTDLDGYEIDDFCLGDTGSMFFGGIVTALAFVMQRPELVLFFGIVYIWDAMTVVIQRTYFKATHGKRIFRMTPIHHAFEMRGWREVKIDGFFALIAVIGVAMGIFYICVA